MPFFLGGVTVGKKLAHRILRRVVGAMAERSTFTRLGDSEMLYCSAVRIARPTDGAYQRSAPYLLLVQIPLLVRHRPADSCSEVCLDRRSDPCRFGEPLFHQNPVNTCLRCLLLVMTTHPLKKRVGRSISCGEGRERYFGCHFVQR